MAKKVTKEFHERIHLIAVALFVLIAIVHAIRIYNNVPAQIGSWVIPMGVSWFGVIIAAVLAYLFWKTSKF